MYYDVVIVGAGPSGVGLAVILRELGFVNMVVIDRHEVGASFRRWPAEMRLITPSFPTNSIGMLDLNSVAIGTSPGFSLKIEHPTGKQYADYLQAVVKHFKVPVRAEIDVQSVDYDPIDDCFKLGTNGRSIRAKYVVWAAGEFQYPRLADFPGAELCLHNSKIQSWTKYTGEDATIIGGYESGLDAAYHLAKLGKKVRVLDKGDPWGSNGSDPSVSISPYTWERVCHISKKTGQLVLTTGAEIERVVKHDKTYSIQTTNGNSFRSYSQPILATGFRNSVQLLHDHFEWRDDGYPLLNEYDESTQQRGLFLAGPGVRHDGHIFCFIYKFRQRWAVIANQLAKRLDYDVAPLENYRKWGMYLDDLSCCGQECVC